MASRTFVDRLLAFPRGLVTLSTDLAQRPDYLRVLENAVPEPLGAHSVRPGTQRATSATLGYEPHSLLEWVSSSGSSNKYVATKGGHLYRITGVALTAQTVPITLGSAEWLEWCQANGALFATEVGGANEPIFYRSSNAANAWLSMNLPAPGAMTLANASGGSVAAGTYYYRLRWRFTDGSSLAGTAQSVTVTNNRVAVTGIPASTRTDYLGWTLERTAAGGSSAGPFQWVADGTGATYNDDFEDSDLGYISSELVHGTIPDGHVSGLIHHCGRLMGWRGSTLYVSQAIGDIEGTGLCNWDARNGYDFGKDDGTEIRAVGKQGDRLLVLKDTSLYAFEGNDLDSFTVVPLHDGAGAAGPRCFASMGTTAWFVGKAGLHRVRGNSVVPFGWVEVGSLYRTSFADARLSEAVLRNHLSQRLVLSFSFDAVRNGDMAVYDMRFNEWARWTGIYAQDILVPKVADFGSRESFLFADSRDRGTNDYRVMIGMIGPKDEKAADGTGGVPIVMQIQTPDLDGGAPDVLKVARRIEIHARGSNVAISATVTMLPTNLSASVSFLLASTGVRWGAQKWGVGKWGASAESASKALGLPIGLIGSKYRVLISASDTTGDTSFRGLVVDGIVLPQRRLS